MAETGGSSKGKRRDRLSGGAWRTLALRRADALTNEVERALLANPQTSAGADADIAVRALNRARDAARPLDGLRDRLRALRHAWTGSEVETAWHSLHDAEQALITIRPESAVRAWLPELRAAVRALLPPRDPRIEEYTAALTLQGGQPLDREQVRAIKRVCDTASDTAHANVRTYRNIVISLGLALLAFAAGLAIWNGVDSSFLRVCEAAREQPVRGQPAGTTVTPCTGSVGLLELEVAGMLGGLIAALWALLRIDVLSGPYRVALYQALLRIPAGAVVAVFAALLVQSGALDVLVPQQGDKVVAYAVLFGFAPEPLLRKLDERATGLMGKARTRNDPVKDGARRSAGPGAA